jgi:hypothetical protein
MNPRRIGIINVIGQSAVASETTRLTEQNVCVLELDGSTVQDLTSFLSQSALDLPQPVSTSPPGNLSALNDNLWQALHGIENAEIAIIWSHSEQLSSTNIFHFLRFTQFFNDLSHDMSHSSHPKSLYIILAGEGAEYQHEE